jgi:hypothetical protein
MKETPFQNCKRENIEKIKPVYTALFVKDIQSLLQRFHLNILNSMVITLPLPLDQRHLMELKQGENKK